MSKNRNPFELLDELLEAKKAKSNVVDTSEDEDTVPMANTKKFAANSNRVVPGIEFDEDEDDSDDEEMETDEDDEKEENPKVNNQDAEVGDFRKKVSEMSMAQVKALRSKLGTKLFDKLLAESGEDGKEMVKEEVPYDDGEAASNDDDDDDDEQPEEESSKKKSRHAPREMSSKKPVSVYRSIDPNAINHARRKFDPRFVERCGEYHESEFRRDYGFIDDLRKNDMQKLSSAIKKAKNPQKKQKIKDLLGRIKSQQNTVEERDLWRETKNELLTNNIDRMMQGLKPVFVNNKQMKERFKEKKLGKIEETKGKKGLEKYLKKKERRESKKKLT